MESLDLKGLSTDEVNLLKRKFGLNEIDGHFSVKTIDIIFRQIGSLFTFLLLFAAIVSYLSGEKLDSLFIIVVILLNIILGFYQEYKAEKSLSELKKITTTLVTVFRDGESKKMDSRDLVVGDLIELFEGDRVPADIKLIGESSFEIDESSLTGESLSVMKGTKKGMDLFLYAGTTVIKGHGYAYVESIGNDTKIGQITKKLTGLKDQKTPLQIKLDKLGQIIGLLGLGLSIIVFIILISQGHEFLISLLFASSLAVAAVPEGLPAIVTITLALGVERMSKRFAILKRLTALEGLGSTTLIATDKTGTLTTNQMRVKYISWGYEEPLHAKKLAKYPNKGLKKIFECVYVCSVADIIKNKDGESEVLGNTTEGAMILLGDEMRWDKELILKDLQIMERGAYDQVKKRVLGVAKNSNGEKFKYVQGAAEYLISEADYIFENNEVIILNESNRVAIKSHILRLSSSGLRLLAFGQYITNKLVFLGFVALEDPIRTEVYAEISAAGKAGIRVVMITGDNELTASRVAEEVGIMSDGDEFLTGSQIDEMSDAALLALLPRVQVFARTTPDHKYRLVTLFQKSGYIVTVTGDGVNDALALKQAEVGVAMGKIGTEVAKETADMVLTDDNFSSLLYAVREGRMIFSHIKQSITYLFCTNATEVFVVLGNIMLHTPFSMTALQLLYINMVSDVIPAISFGFKKSKKNVWMKRFNKELLSKSDISYILSLSIFMAFLILFSSKIYMDIFPGVQTSIVFVSLIGMQLIIYIDIWVEKLNVTELKMLIKNSYFILSLCTLVGLATVVMIFSHTREILHLNYLSKLEFIIVICINLILLVPIYFFRITKKVTV